MHHSTVYRKRNGAQRARRSHRAASHHREHCSLLHKSLSATERAKKRPSAASYSHYTEHTELYVASHSWVSTLMVLSLLHPKLLVGTRTNL